MITHKCEEIKKEETVRRHAENIAGSGYINKEDGFWVLCFIPIHNEPFVQKIRIDYCPYCGVKL